MNRDDHKDGTLNALDDHDYAEEAPSVWARVQATHQQKKASRGAASRLPKFAAALVLACIVAVPAYGLWQERGPKPLRLATGDPLPAMWTTTTEGETVELSDGSLLHLGPGSQVRVLLNDAEHVELLHRAGAVTYEVERRGRLWRVDAGLAAIEVVGTRFTVSRAGEVHVRVDEGRVLVRSTLFEDGVALLTAGNDVHLPSLARGERTTASGLETAASEALLPPPGRLTYVGTASATLLDRARDLGQSGRPQEAAALLHLVVERNEPASAEAAYLLGDLHQEIRPELAVHDFAVAIRLGVSEPLREEAFRRRIEAASVAGLPTEPLEASLRANYPNASRLQ